MREWRDGRVRGGREEDKCWEGAEEGSVDDGLVEGQTVVIFKVGVDEVGNNRREGIWAVIG